MTVIPERLELLDKLILDSGSHSAAELVEEWNKTACLLELTAYIAGEPWSASPKCVSPVLTSFGIRLNDSLPEDKRQALKQFIPDLIGTRDDGHDDARRGLARQWLMAGWLPQWLRLAKLDDLAVRAEQSATLTGSDLRAAVYAIRDLTWKERVARQNALKAEVEKRLRGKWAAEGRPDAVAVAVAAAAADAVAAAAAVAVADAVSKLGYAGLYWPVRKALEKHYAESDTFAAIRGLRDRQLDAAVELFGEMARIGRAA